MNLFKHINNRASKIALASAVVVCWFFGFANMVQAHPEHLIVSKGSRVLTDPTGTVSIKMLVEQPDVEIGELYLAEAYGSGALHTHGVNEYIYVTSGELGHTIDGKLHVLKPGMVGVVKPGQQVGHSVLSKGPVKALIVWVPGGEASKLLEVGFKSTPVEK
ncbi:hypothetical protein COB64_01040 [Candidatus Wolfebacteria bacterium]|nr:MAG: hypothetical protein COB64_01040 [Candidatus Wolfebacteria bacterium]